MKTSIHTHYDNLKVSRDAPVEVIRAAYRTLSKKYHPDHNPDNPSAMRITQLINSAYEVLSDPVRRKEHDEWIEREEGALKAGASRVSRNPAHPYGASFHDLQGYSSQKKASPGGRHRSFHENQGILAKLMAGCDALLRQFSHRSRP